jgi:hypothetical protein
LVAGGSGDAVDCLLDPAESAGQRRVHGPRGLLYGHGCVNGRLDRLENRVDDRSCSGAHVGNRVGDRRR